MAETTRYRIPRKQFLRVLRTPYGNKLGSDLDISRGWAKVLKIAWGLTGLKPF
jgi:hypothetical protein